MKLLVSVPAPDDGALTAEAARAWETFKQKVGHPLTKYQPTYGDTWLAAGRKGGVMVDHARDRVHIILEKELLKNADDLEACLTLLHECIHVDFALGEHRARWERRYRITETYEKELNNKESDGTEPAEILAYTKRRIRAAFVVVQLPDEIVAEQRLKHHFPDWFNARAEYYVRMQRDHEAELTAQRPDDPLWPFNIFHRLLCIALFIPLVSDVPALDELKTELQRLARKADDRLRDCASSELHAALMELKPLLLDVDASSEKLALAEAAYDTLFNRIMAVEPPAIAATH